jgi:vacuolar protein sorting-associated protein 13A/C
LEYNIDEILEHQPKHAVGHPARALRVTILKEGKMNIVRISDWMPENEPSLITGRRVQPPSPQPSGNVSPQQQLPSSTGCKFHVVLELAGLGTSVTEHTPRRFYTCQSRISF